MGSRKTKGNQQKRTTVIPDMADGETLQALTTLAKALQVEVRTEKGDFKGGLCRVEGDNVIFLKKQDPDHKKIDVLAKELKGFDLNDIYVMPAIRTLLDQAK